MKIPGKSKTFFLLIALLLSIASFAQQPIEVVKSLPLGSVVSISGTISTGPEWGTIRYIQDHSGGIGLFSTSLAGTQAGDSLSLSGVLSSYRGQLQISPVLSFQLLESNKQVVPTVLSSLDTVYTIQHNSEMVTLYCPGVHSCEITYSPGTVNMYDQQGNCITAVISDVSYLFGKRVYEEHAFVTGILYTLEGQQRLLIDSLSPQAACDNIHPPLVFYDDRDIRIGNGPLPGRLTFVEWGQEDFNEQSDFGIIEPNTYVGSNLSHLPAGELYQYRLKQVDGQDTFYSKTVHFTPALSGEPIEVYFNRNIDPTFSDGSSPIAVGGTVIEQSLIKAIDSVSLTLDIAMYNIGRDPIVQAINRAVNRGVAVRYITDDETSNNSLDIADFTVAFRAGDGIMHHKFIVADASDSLKAWLWAGSTNLTSNQLSTDPNHAYFIKNKPLAQTYQREFEEMWGINGQINSRTGEVKNDNTCHLFKHQNTLIESYFSPSDETECRIMDAIDQADHQLLIGLLLLTSDGLINKIVDVHESGIEVRVILEDRESSSYAANRLELAGVPFAIHDPGPIYHHKIAIIDEGYTDSDPTVITGSHNWTWSADHINDENTLIMHDQSIANIFRQEYEARWSELDPIATEAFIEPYVRVFPNPVTSQLHIDNPTTSTMLVEMYDARGWLCQSAIAASNDALDMQINSSLPNGLYTIRMTDGKRFLAEKIILQR